MRLLCIANPLVYGRTRTDVPLNYAHLAAHPDVELFHANTEAFRQTGRVIRAVPVTPRFRPEDFAELDRRASVARRIQEFDLGFCRTLKPYPPGYLESLQEHARRLPFLNSPSGIRRQLDPAFFLGDAAGFLPATLATDDPVAAQRFVRRHQAVVAKQSNSCGGNGVHRILLTGGGRLVVDNVVLRTRTFESFSTLFAELTNGYSEPVLLMRYLPDVKRGDKRIVVVDGEIYGAYLRISTSGHWIQNVSRGASCVLTTVRPEERAAIAATHGRYREAGVHILGYDFLRDENGRWKLSEINAGNVGGLSRLEQLGVKGTTDRFVEWLKDFGQRTRSGAITGVRWPPPVRHDGNRTHPIHGPEMHEGVLP